jgi:DNA topoisomerase I
MAKSLVIVESPAKAKTINKFLGPRYIVKPTGGHLIDLPVDRLGIDIEKDFEPQYTTIKGKNKALQELKKAAKGAEAVLLATDPDREGEAIAWHVANRIVGKDQPLYRVLINQITKDAVRSAVEDKGVLDINKVDAQQARRVLDRLVGYQVSPVLWKAIYKGLSAGRVQSVALRLIVERDAEVSVFEPVEYWDIVVRLAAGDGEEFEAKLLRKDGDPISIPTGEDAERIASELAGLPYSVTEVAKKSKKRYPAPPFITSTLQQEAARRVRYTVQRTMRIAQTLYEGVELDDGSTGLITYMRTDSTRIAPEAISDVRSYIGARWGAGDVPSKPNYYKARKGAQDAHEAIRPASMQLTPEKVKRFLTGDQYKLYLLIWNRFVASQMKPAQYEVITADIAAGGYGLRANASNLTYKGFLAVYEDIAGDDDDTPAKDVDHLPPLAKGDSVEHRETIPAQHFTKPPPHYTEASLVRELESLGIGRPSTYAQIINTILNRKYVEREKGRLLSTDLGQQVKNILVTHFPDIFNVGFTASMELELDKIEAGDNPWKEVINGFFGPFSATLEEVKGKTAELKKQLIEETGEVCEKCGKAMIIRWGRNGKFMACSGFPDCKNTKPLAEEAPAATDEVCEKCGSAMEIKNGRYGRFMACSNYPECKNIKPISLGLKCPEEGCDGDIVEKRSKKGRIFYGCNSYPKCKFASWKKPVKGPCSVCDSPTLIEERPGESNTCPRCKTEHDVAI